tara:strand:+ start:134 stop:1825 length:1692 start_codon:yes stop_codon:yes gene_type:complete
MQIFRFIISVLLCFFLSSCSLFYHEKDPIDISQLTVDQKVGQLCLVSMYGSGHQNILDVIDARHIGGVIFYKENRHPENSLLIKEKLATISSLKVPNIPIFTSVDHEGIGLAEYGTAFPRMMALGYLNDLELTESVGYIIGKELHYSGIDVVYAPVLDVNLSASNTVIASRSFSSSPEQVAKHGKAFINGIMAGGTIPVAKHFPGHGLTTQDSHIGLPQSDHSVKELNKLALYPFKYTKKVPMIMSAHIYFSELDKENPATLSKTILTDLLRKKVKFEGVVITDHMEMKAVRKNLSIEEASLKAILAGSDIVMLGENTTQINRVIDYLIESVNNGTLPMERLDQAVKRIIKMKRKYGLFDSPLLASAENVLKHPDHQAVATKVIKESVHVVELDTEKTSPKNIKSALVVSGSPSFNRQVKSVLNERSIRPVSVILEKPLTHSEKWSYISKIMTEKIVLTPELEDLIKHDKRIAESIKMTIKNKAEAVDLIIVGVQTSAEAEDLNKLAAEINVPIIGLFFGTRYDAPILYEKCANFYSSIIAFNNYHTKSLALEEMIKKLNSYL